MNKHKIENSELFDSAHMILLSAFSIFSLILIGETLLLGWETWVLLVIVFELGLCWLMHIRQMLTPNARLWVYSFLMMLTFFFYGIHETSTFDLAVVMSALIMLYTMTGVRNLVTLCQVTYYITLGYAVISMLVRGTQFDALMISRTLMHMAMIFMVGFFSRTIIDKWAQVLEESMTEIDLLKDSTERLDDFLANVSHEIRTPVNAVIGLSGVCIEKDNGSEIASDLISIQQAGKRVGEQISDILDYSEIDRAMLVKNDEDYMLDSLLNDLVVQLKPYKNPEIELVIDVDPAIPSVMNGDAVKLKKILWHLILNGLKYTIEGGVYVRITSIEETYGINLRIEVTDTGIGMSSDELERISEKFYQVNSGRSRLGGGLGLGIPIVNGFVASLGGFMTMNSKVGEGTTVRVSIPQKIVDPAGCMSLARRESLCLGAYLHFDKYPNPNVREYYNRMVKNIVYGLGVQMHRVDNIENLKKLVDSVNLTHLFVAEEEYGTDPEYLEKLAHEVIVVVVANPGFKLPRGSKAIIMEKPFYCFPVATVLNMDINEEQSEYKMMCPGVEALVVDDEPMNLTVAKGIFKGYGMKVTTVLSGHESVEICRNRHFDIIFMDHMMPGMDGIEAMKTIRSDKEGICKDTPVVALTANAVSTAKEMFLSEGFDGFVSKPVEIAELERVLKRVLPKSSITFELIQDEPGEELSGYRSLKAAGINVSVGLSYSQKDEELYNSLLKQFVKDSFIKQSQLEDYHSAKDYKNYEIVVHALKSTAKLIGAMDLSDKAKALEEAAKAGGRGLSADAHNLMLAEYRKVSASIEKMFDTKPVENAGNDAVVLEFSPHNEGGDL